MTKRDFFKCFYPAWQKAFTDKNIASSWCKTGLFPFDPGLVLDKLWTFKTRESMRRSKRKRTESMELKRGLLQTSERSRRLRRGVTAGLQLKLLGRLPKFSRRPKELQRERGQKDSKTG